MKKRLLTAAVGLPAVIAIFFIGKNALFALILVLNFICLYEYIKATSRRPKIVSYVYMMSAGTSLIFAGAFYDKMLMPVFAFCVMLIFIFNIIMADTSGSAAVHEVWGLIYISLFLALASGLLMHESGYFLVVMTVLSTIACDSFAYLAGIKFGRHKICPRVSPKKSWEGSIAGFVSAVSVFGLGYFAQPLFKGHTYPVIFCIAGGVLTGVFSQYGDLAASLIKREFEVKDYGDVLPGHGGFLDRIDGILFALATMYICVICAVQLKQSGLL